MQYITTLNKVRQSELESLGFRAVDLALLREKRLNIPLSLVINNSAFEEFVKENGMHAKLEKIYNGKSGLDSQEACKQVYEMFEKAVLPKDFEDELFEAYESLAIDPGEPAARIVSEWDFPFVTLYRSPSYLLPAGDDEGVVQNIRGKNEFVAALKQVWASLYTPASRAYRQKSSIRSFHTGVIVQKMKKARHSAAAVYDSENKQITINSFIGYHDFGLKPIMGKDIHIVETDSLSIKEADVQVQEYALSRESETGGLVKKPLKESGSRQKINDKQVYEAARVAKRAHSFLGKELKLIMGIRDDYTYVFLADRFAPGSSRVVEEKEEIKVVEKNGEKQVEQSREISGRQEAGEQGPAKKEKLQPATMDEQADAEAVVEMPKIISKQEAMQEIGAEAGGADVIKKPGIEVIYESEEDKSGEEHEQHEEQELPDEEKSSQEQEVEKEVNLLREVLTIKEIIERMEEHALNENQEAYSQEVKLLKEMIDKARHDSE